MLRSLLLAVLAANLAFFAWSQGWLAPSWPGPRAAQAEPQRLANQVRPEWVRVVPAAYAASVRAARRREAPPCLEAGPFSEGALAAAEASLVAASVPAGSWARRNDRSGQAWLRAAQLPEAVQTQLLALPVTDLAKGFKPCRAP